MPCAVVNAVIATSEMQLFVLFYDYTLELAAWLQGKWNTVAIVTGCGGVVVAQHVVIKHDKVIPW